MFFDLGKITGRTENFKNQTKIKLCSNKFE